MAIADEHKMGASTDSLALKKQLDNMSEVDIKKEKRMIMKNIILISVSFLFVFNAFQGLSRLQSSLHLTAGMGVINSSVLYGALVISCLLVPKFLISLIGHKWTIPLSFCGYILWMAANGYAVWETMVPASILVGLCAAPLWTAQCSYFTMMASRYAQINREEEGTVVTRFFGIFFFFFQVSNITGSVISSTILEPKVVNNSEEEPPSGASLLYCGVNDCPGNPTNETKLESPDSDVVWTMLGVYIAIAVCAVLLVIITVDQLPKHLLEKQDTGAGTVQLLVATARQLRHKEQLLIIPITMYSGFEQAFYSAEFTKSFVSCPIGIWMVGLVTIPFGVVNAIVSFTGGRLVEYTGRLPIFTFGLFVDIAIQVTLMLWTPDPTKEYVLFILSSMWGLTDGIWQTQINALVGNLFPNESEAAFSNYRLWESMGFIVAFAYSTFLCTSYKLYILTGVLVIGMMGYYTVEFTVRKSASGDIAEGREKSHGAVDNVAVRKVSYMNDSAL